MLWHYLKGEYLRGNKDLETIEMLGWMGGSEFILNMERNVTLCCAQSWEIRNINHNHNVIWEKKQK